MSHCLARGVRGGARSPYGTDRLRRPVRKRFRYWRLTGSTAVVPVLLRLTRFGHSAHQGGSISPLIIFTTCDASANSVAAIAKVTLIRLSLGRAISIDNFFGTKSMRRNKK